MKEELLKFVEDGISIRKIKDGYDVFTTKTQWFEILNLGELTAERFEDVVKELQKKLSKSS